MGRLGNRASRVKMQNHLWSSRSQVQRRFLEIGWDSIFCRPTPGSRQKKVITWSIPSEGLDLTSLDFFLVESISLPHGNSPILVIVKIDEKMLLDWKSLQVSGLILFKDGLHCYMHAFVATCQRIEESAVRLLTIYHLVAHT